MASGFLSRSIGTLSGFSPGQKFAQSTATLQFKRLSLARQASLNKFAAGSRANQQILRKAVVKTGGFTKIFINPAINPGRPGPLTIASRPAGPVRTETPKKFQALHLYKLAFRQPVKFPGFSPKNISVLGGRYLVWGISGADEYSVFVYVLSESGNTTKTGALAVKQSQSAGVVIIIVGILAVLGLGLSIILFKDVKEVIGAGGLGITFALAIALGSFFLFKKIT